MNAKTLARKMGVKLIGRWVMTEQVGEWPGGRAHVFALSLDPNSPEIVFHVSQGGQTIGVFGGEEVELLEVSSKPGWKQKVAEDLTHVCTALPNAGIARAAFERLRERVTEFEELHKP